MVMALSRISEKKVVIDTSALLTLCEGYDFFTSVEKELGKVKYVVPTSVITELEKLAEETPKYARCLNLIKRIIEKNQILVIYTGENKNYADDDLLNMTADLFVTNDMTLAKKLKQQNKKVFILKKNRYYDYY